MSAPHFSTQINCQTGASAGAMTTIAALKLGSARRVRLRELRIGGGGGTTAAQDLQVELQLRRSDQTTDGTSTSQNVNTIAKGNPDQVAASGVSAIGHTFTVEPTTIDNGLIGLGAFNTRGVFHAVWGPGEGPLWDVSTTILLQGAPTTATAAELSVGIAWDEVDA